MSKITINHEYLLRIAYYSGSHYPQEAITEDMFKETFGNIIGGHYHDKWQNTYRYDILKMIVYFGRDIKEGQKFCQILEIQIEKYEERVGI